MAASIASRANVRDDREAPLSAGAGRREALKMICPTAKAKYFCRRDWTVGIRLIRLDKFVVARKAKIGSPSTQSERTEHDLRANAFAFVARKKQLFLDHALAKPARAC
jgi:hypothetical protein